ncbi:MAG: pirin family protein [Bacteroidota bacterium]|nr:pirin family protein [Bacteroidota bacterium]
MNQNPIIKIKPLGFVWETADPFLFCVHHDDKFPKGNEHMGPDASLEGRQIGQDFMIKDGWRMYHGQRVPGFPYHPHRGFETITVVRKGIVDHADSMGAAGRYGNGDVQWMTAGKGVQHSEMFPLLNRDKENPMELFQIWLNLPRKSKMSEPHFMMMWNENIPKVNVKDQNGHKTLVEVIVGKIENKIGQTPPPDSWANDQSNEVAIWNLILSPNSTYTLPKTSKGINRTIYFYLGNELKLNGESLNEYHSADVQPDMDLLLTNGNSESRVLVLQGKPIGEPVVQHGPFVMNTREEINQAFADYQRTQFGGWPWPNGDQVHPRSKGRFARHADGREEIKG